MFYSFVLNVYVVNDGNVTVT